MRQARRILDHHHQLRLRFAHWPRRSAPRPLRRSAPRPSRRLLGHRAGIAGSGTHARNPAKVTYGTTGTGPLMGSATVSDVGGASPKPVADRPTAHGTDRGGLRRRGRRAGTKKAQLTRFFASVHPVWTTPRLRCHWFYPGSRRRRWGRVPPPGKGAHSSWSRTRAGSHCRSSWTAFGTASLTTCSV